MGKRPYDNPDWPEEPWEWFLSESSTADEDELSYDLYHAYTEVYALFYETFHAAMDAAAIAWVRANRDREFGLVTQEQGD